MAMRWVIRVRTLMRTNRRRMSSPSLCPFIRTTAKLNRWGASISYIRRKPQPTPYKPPIYNQQPPTCILQPLHSFTTRTSRWCMVSAASVVSTRKSRTPCIPTSASERCPIVYLGRTKKKDKKYKKYKKCGHVGVWSRKTSMCVGCQYLGWVVPDGVGMCLENMYPLPP